MTIIDDIAALLQEVDDEFVPSLSSRINVGQYAEKIARKATVFCIYDEGILCAFASVYCNDTEHKRAYLTMIAVGKRYQGKKIGVNLLKSSIQHLRGIGISTLHLEVYKNNNRAIDLYKKVGFDIMDETENSYFMRLQII
ncbi:MAG TPA: GNAT family N-acetyltransferase [Candidatus Paceibacterota bacterium]|nr:GNAT family N-acetyltransferase [Candidatus Paceibacterota bacterium]